MNECCDRPDAVQHIGYANDGAEIWRCKYCLELHTTVITYNQQSE